MQELPEDMILDRELKEVKEGAKKVFKVEECHGLIGTLVDGGILWPGCGVRVGAVVVIWSSAVLVEMQG